MRPSLKNTTDLATWDTIFRAKAAALYPSTDPSHDALHIARVVKVAVRLAEEEGADLNIVIPAAYFHDFVNVPKSDARRSAASQLSADAACEYLLSIGYPSLYIGGIKHAIAAHSFSAGIKPETIEAQVVQDADRLDALGAIGIARCFSNTAILEASYYNADDPWAKGRSLDDRRYSVDHFEIKLYKLASLMNTKAGRAEATKRIDFMKGYMAQLKTEVE